MGHMNRELITHLSLMGKARISETSSAGGCTTGCTIVPKQERSSPNKGRLSEHKSLIPNNKRWTRAIC
jgi:hypothetical protein